MNFQASEVGRSSRQFAAVEEDLGAMAQEEQEALVLNNKLFCYLGFSFIFCWNLQELEISLIRRQVVDPEECIKMFIQILN